MEKIRKMDKEKIKEMIKVLEEDVTFHGTQRNEEIKKTFKIMEALTFAISIISSVLEGKLVEVMSVEEIEETISNIYGIGEPYLRQIAQAITKEINNETT